MPKHCFKSRLNIQAASSRGQNVAYCMHGFASNMFCQFHTRKVYFWHKLALLYLNPEIVSYLSCNVNLMRPLFSILTSILRPKLAKECFYFDKEPWI